MTTVQRSLIAITLFIVACSHGSHGEPIKQPIAPDDPSIKQRFDDLTHVRIAKELAGGRVGCRPRGAPL